MTFTNADKGIMQGSGVWEQVHRGIKGVVKDTDGNGIKGASVTVRGIRKDVTTGKSPTIVEHQRSESILNQRFQQI